MSAYSQPAELTAELRPALRLFHCLRIRRFPDRVAADWLENPDVSCAAARGGPAKRTTLQAVMEAGPVASEPWAAERDFGGLRGQPNPHLNGPLHSIEYGAGAGCESSINVMAVWAGEDHKSDWEFLSQPRLATARRGALWSRC